MFLKQVFGEGKMKQHFKIKISCKVVEVYICQTNGINVQKGVQVGDHRKLMKHKK